MENLAFGNWDLNSICGLNFGIFSKVYLTQNQLQGLVVFKMHRLTIITPYE